MRRLALLAAVLAALAPAAAGAAATGAQGSASFRTQAGDVGCFWVDTGSFRNLRCDLRGRLKPFPPRAKSCVEGDWGFGLTMHLTGKVEVVCAGDSALDPASPALRNGATWRRGDFTCTAQNRGLRCLNGAKHGFFLSVARWQVF